MSTATLQRPGADGHGATVGPAPVVAVVVEWRGRIVLFGADPPGKLAGYSQEGRGENVCRGSWETEHELRIVRSQMWLQERL